jgi:polysaccharide biosynthesis/export protein
MRYVLLGVFGTCLSVLVLQARQDVRSPDGARAKALAPGLPAANQIPRSENSEYVLGPDDQISIWVSDAVDISGKAMNIDPGGAITLPLLGRVQAAGLTTFQLEASLRKELKFYFIDPQVVVNVTEFRSQPVSVIGAVNQPGVHQLRGHKTLVEVLSLAGGIRTDAGYRVTITRSVDWGAIPLPGAKADSSGQYTVAEVELKDLMTAANPQANILIRPNDVISVPVGELIYVIGEVNKAGGFVLAERQTISVLQALALAGGLGPQSSAKNARILRSEDGRTSRAEIHIDVSKILQGKAKDVSLNAEDILFIPNSVPRKAAVKAAETALQTATGIAIFRSGRY